MVSDFCWYDYLGISGTLWFIDYCIKRNPRYQEPTEELSKEPPESPPRAFYASDRRFVEVKKEQLGHGGGHDRMWDIDYESSGRGLPRLLWFALILLEAHRQGVLHLQLWPKLFGWEPRRR